MIFRLGTDALVQARNGLDVVIEDVGLFVENRLECVPISTEIGDENFDVGVRGLEADLADRLGPYFGAAVGQFVSINAGDDNVIESHRGNGVTDASGFVEIEGRRPAGGDVAETAAARADVAEDHERRGAGAPAFAHVGTFCGLADGVEVLVVYEFREPSVTLAAGHFHFQPGRFSHRGSHGRGAVGEEKMAEGDVHKTKCEHEGREGAKEAAKKA